MKVAVLIPLYNHERYIGAAMASLRAQTRPPDRVIVLDDGSTDGSLGAMMAYSATAPASAIPGQPAGVEPRIDILFQPNAGAHAALNRLVALADDCDYIAILNSDDCYHPRRLERCLEYLDAHPETGLLCTRLRLIDENGENSARRRAALALVLSRVELSRRQRRRQHARHCRMARAGQFPRHDEQLRRPRRFPAHSAVRQLPLRA